MRRTYLTAEVVSSVVQRQIESTYGNPAHAQGIHATIIKAGFQANTNLAIKLLILRLKCRCLHSARRLFDEMPSPTLSAYSYMISGYFRRGYVAETLDLVRKLRFSDETPYWFVMSMVLKLSTAMQPVIAKQVHAQILKSVLQFDEVLYTALIDSYAKIGKLEYAKRVFRQLGSGNCACSTALITGYMNCGSIEDAESIFEDTVDRDAVVFNAMIEGYSRKVDTGKKSFEIYKKMQRSDFRPSISTFASVIGACSILSELDLGRQIHCQLIKTDSEAFYHVKSGSALVDMYCKCGRTEDARRVFDEMPIKNVVTWTSMIDGYGKNGTSDEALKLFDKMSKSSPDTTKPNDVTVLAVLSACGHAGLVSEGMEIFDRMERVNGMKPRMEHYACVVDLLGRSGSLREAYNFIVDRIPEKPNSDVWAALLGACRLHGNVVMAGVAGKKLLELSAEDRRRPGAYVALSNTFAEAGKWGSVCDVRDMMKERSVSKEHGQSWVASDDR